MSSSYCAGDDVMDSDVEEEDLDDAEEQITQSDEEEETMDH